MIIFDCPSCGEEMEISDRMAGKLVRCVECGKKVRVPEDDEYEDEEEVRPRRNPFRREDKGLSAGAFWGFIVLFLLIPAANVWVSSILYYVWRSSEPRKANQINRLGFAIFGIHILLFILIAVVSAHLH